MRHDNQGLINGKCHFAVAIHFPYSHYFKHNTHSPYSQRDNKAFSPLKQTTHFTAHAWSWPNEAGGHSQGRLQWLLGAILRDLLPRGSDLQLSQ